MPNDTLSQQPIIFFDGECGMCNGFVDLMLRVDRKKQFSFAPIQGETARELLPPLGDDPEEWSMVYRDEHGIHNQSDASLEVFRRLGGLWSILSWLRLVPRVVRNPIYRIIARNRYRLFGKREGCRLPPPQERARFLP